MLIYEKKVNDERHIFGTTANVPSESDNQLKYYDTQFEELSPTLNDTYLDNGHGGIIQKSTGIQILSQFEDSEGNMVSVVPQVKAEQIAFISADTRDFLTEYVVGQELDLSGLIVNVIKGDNSSEQITDYTTSLEDGHIMTLEDTELKVIWGSYYTIVPLTVSESRYRLEWRTPPTKTEYEQYELFDPTGSEIFVIDNTGVEEPADITQDCVFSPISLGASGNISVTATYTADEDITVTQTVQVSPRTIESVELSYDEEKYPSGYFEHGAGESLAPLFDGEDGDLFAEVTFNEGESKLLTYAWDNIRLDTFTVTPATVPEETPGTDFEISVTYYGVESNKINAKVGAPE